MNKTAKKSGVKKMGRKKMKNTKGGSGVDALVTSNDTKQRRFGSERSWPPAQ